MSKIKVVHYINQFFAQIGGEEKADYPAEIRVGEVVGPGLALTQNFKDEAEIIATVICGDSYFNENLEKAKADILAMVRSTHRFLYKCIPFFTHRALSEPLALLMSTILTEIYTLLCFCHYFLTTLISISFPASASALTLSFPLKFVVISPIFTSSMYTTYSASASIPSVN